MAISARREGNYALIGGPGDKEGIGAAWVFTRSGTTWTQQGAKLTRQRREAGTGSFGVSVALSAEGDYCADRRLPATTEGIGAAWVFTRSGTTWTQQGEKLTRQRRRESAKANPPAKANSATAWRCPSKADTTR